MVKEFGFSKQVMAEIYAQAEKEYPGECCGWVIENADGSQSYSASVNLQDKYHKLDPEAYPRTSKDAFLMDVLKLSKAIEEAESSGARLYSIVHSHIDVDAYFSTEDKKQMTDHESKTQIYASSCYLVVAIKEKQHAEDAVFYFDNESKEFILGNVVMV